MQAIRNGSPPSRRTWHKMVKGILIDLPFLPATKLLVQERMLSYSYILSTLEEVILNRRFNLDGKGIKTLKEIAETQNKKPIEIHRLFYGALKKLSLSLPAKKAPQTLKIKKATPELVAKRINKYDILTPKEERVLEARFGTGKEPPKTLEELSEIYHSFHQGIAQLQNHALKKLALLPPSKGEWYIIRQQLEDLPIKKATPQSVQERLTRHGDHLSTQESNVLALRFGLNGKDPHFLEQVAKSLKTSKKVVTQIQSHALKKLHLNSPTFSGWRKILRHKIPGSLPWKSATPQLVTERLDSYGELLTLYRKYILTLRFGLNGKKPKTHSVIAKRLLRAEPDIVQTQNHALNILKLFPPSFLEWRKMKRYHSVGSN